ncbi:MAG: hypothetical protein WCD79_20740 [Chthoniobacteraceae bacterium]
MLRIADYKNDIIACLLAVLFLLVPLSAGYQLQGSTMDEGVLLVYPELVLKGKVPYRDFETFYGPANIYVLAGFYSLFGTDVDVERSVGLLYELAILIAIYCLARRHGPIIATGCMLLAGYFMPVMQVGAFAWTGGIAFGLWAVWMGTSLRGKWPAFFTGLLAAFALLYRPDLGPAVLVSAIPALMAMAGRERLACGIGFGAGLVPLLWVTAVAGPLEVVNNLFLYPVIHGSAGRRLPILGAEPWLIRLLVIHLAAAIFNVIAGILSVRADGTSMQARRQLAVSLFALCISHQALQRLDSVHLVFSCFLSIGILPMSIYSVVGMRRSAGRGWSALAVAIAAGLVIAAGPNVAAYFYNRVHAGLAAQNNAALFISVNHRRYALQPANAVKVQILLSVLSRKAKEGERLFVGPADLRRTNYNDSYIYHLMMPQLVPATYFLEMNALSANRPHSRLAADVSSADWVLLIHDWDDWYEPNDSAKYGSDAPNEVVRKQFYLFCKLEKYDLYRKKGE